jgi:hypothetical protein
MPLGPNGYDLTVMIPFRGSRFNNSVATNGHFWAGPVTQVITNTATYFFTYRFFANHSASNPEGYLDVETLKSFQGVTGTPGNFQWESGRERIPDNVCKPPTPLHSLLILFFCFCAKTCANFLCFNNNSGTAAQSATTTASRPSISTSTATSKPCLTRSSWAATRASPTRLPASTLRI